MVLEETIFQETNSFHYFCYYIHTYLQNLKTKNFCFYFNKEGAPEVYLEGVIKNGRLLKKIEQKTMIACRLVEQRLRLRLVFWPWITK